ncbi:MAG: hypothetical protein ACRELB_03250, partial [Polyangiaceae bacterium]
VLDRSGGVPGQGSRTGRAKEPPARDPVALPAVPAAHVQHAFVAGFACMTPGTTLALGVVMKWVPGRAISSFVALSCVLGACGGRTDGGGASGDHGDGGSGSSEAGASSSGGGSSSGGTTSSDAGSTQEDSGITSSDGGFCIDIDTSTYDTSCAVDDDCINVSAGVICAGYNCLCGGSTVSASEQARYEAALATVPQGKGPFCSCPYFGRPRCIATQCVFCPSSIGGSDPPPGCPDGG